MITDGLYQYENRQLERDQKVPPIHLTSEAATRILVLDVQGEDWYGPDKEDAGIRADLAGSATGIDWTPKGSRTLVFARRVSKGHRAAFLSGKATERFRSFMEEFVKTNYSGGRKPPSAWYVEYLEQLEAVVDSAARNERRHEYPKWVCFAGSGVDLSTESLESRELAATLNSRNEAFLSAIYAAAKVP
jgi:hypothetical protein